MPTLFDPIQLGDISLNNRIIMAPLTRARAGTSRIPNLLMQEYYAQRASAGLIISEATAISPEGYGWKNSPGNYTDEHEQGWRAVTDAVHQKGGKIVLQLWHMGRLSHSHFLNGALPLAPSAIAAQGFAYSVGHDVPYETPRVITRDEIKRTIEDFALGARRAIRAGFDGVEIHGANGYLIDQFLHPDSNTRDDEYSGTVENHTRFLIEVVTAVTAEIGAARTGLRLSPRGGNSILNNNLVETFTHAAKKLAPFNLAFLHVRETWHDENNQAIPLAITPEMRRVYPGVIIANDGYDFASATQLLNDKVADAVAFGKLFIANPDLVARFATQAPLNVPNPKTFYALGSAGLTDYPFL